MTNPMLNRVTNPYWLIREKGRTVGCGAIDYSDAYSSESALEVFWRTLDPVFKSMMAHLDMEAVLVRLDYADGDENRPVVTEVR
jgi:hypothetical protein